MRFGNISDTEKNHNKKKLKRFEMKKMIGIINIFNRFKINKINIGIEV